MSQILKEQAFIDKIKDLEDEIAKLQEREDSADKRIAHYRGLYTDMRDERDKWVDEVTAYKNKLHNALGSQVNRDELLKLQIENSKLRSELHSVRKGLSGWVKQIESNLK